MRTTMSETTLDSTIIETETVRKYFETFNAGDFEATAQLFTADAVMHAPFKTEVVGDEAIANYLQTQAKGMEAVPQNVTTQPLEGGATEAQVTGYAKFAGFKVNIAWTFQLDPAQEITDIEIKLIASAQELLKMRGAQPQQNIQ